MSEAEAFLSTPSVLYGSAIAELDGDAWKCWVVC
jgi:hypothetical protein